MSTDPKSRSPGRFAAIKTGGKKLWDKGWDLSGQYIGEPANRFVGRKFGMESFWPTSSEKEFDKAARILRVFTLDGGVAVDEKLNEADASAHKKKQRVIKKIPPAVIENAKGIAIFTVWRTGLHVSAASGSGIVVSKLPDGSWSAPSGILIHTLGIGFVIGIDIYDIVLVLNTDAAVRQFTHPRVKLGGEVSVAAGPVGEGRQLDVSRSASWSYVKSKGFYAGAQVDGTIIIERGDENERFYGRRASAEDLLAGRMPPPHQADGLYQVLAAAAGKPIGYDKIPQGLGPAEHHEDFAQAQASGAIPPPDGPAHAQQPWPSSSPAPPQGYAPPPQGYPPPPAYSPSTAGDQYPTQGYQQPYQYPNASGQESGILQQHPPTNVTSNTQQPTSGYPPAPQQPREYPVEKQDDSKQA